MGQTVGHGAAGSAPLGAGREVRHALLALMPAEKLWMRWGQPGERKAWLLVPGVLKFTVRLHSKLIFKVLFILEMVKTQC